MPASWSRATVVENFPQRQETRNTLSPQWNENGL